MNNNNYSITLEQNNTNITDSFIIFKINNKKYGIDIKNIIEVINLPEIEISMQPPEGIIGTLNYNGSIIKVVDLSVLLGFEPSQFSINNQLIIVCAEDNYFAIHTQKIEDIIQIPPEDLQLIPFEIENSIIKEVYEDEDNTINIIDINLTEKALSERKSNISKTDYSKLLPSDEKSKQILNLRSAQHKKNREIFSFPLELNTVNQYILFKLDNHNYYLDLKYVKEFVSIKRLNITKLPYTQDYIKGIINLKGNFLVIIDLKRFLNNEISDIKEGSKVIVVKGKNFDIALLVDEIKYIKNLNDIKKDSIYSNNSKYIYTEFMEEDKLYSILNFDKIINDERLFINIE